MNPLYLSRAVVACLRQRQHRLHPGTVGRGRLGDPPGKHGDRQPGPPRLRERNPPVRRRGEHPPARHVPDSPQADGTTLQSQDATATNVKVPLDQWFYTSFTIKDGEASKSFQDLVDIYLRPGMMTIARSVDRAVLGRVHGFLGTPGASASAGWATSRRATARTTCWRPARQLNVNKAPLEGRNLVLAPVSETALLKNELFIAAQMRGDFGTALESATLGRILGFDTYMDQNVNSVSVQNCDVDATGTVTNALAAGSGGSQAVTLADYAVNVGEFAVVAGNDQPTYITAATTGTGATTAITLNEANKYATAAGAAADGLQGVQRAAATYAAGWVEGIVVTGWAAAAANRPVGRLRHGCGPRRPTP